MTDAPERIWAQKTACENWDEPVATPHNVPHFQEYVRADLLTPLQAENDRLHRVASVVRNPNWQVDEPNDFDQLPEDWQRYIDDLHRYIADVMAATRAIVQQKDFVDG